MNATDWIHALIDQLAAGEAAVLLTVVHAVGSTPRAAGATMVVGHAQHCGSIGGGQLELQAESAAFALLERDSPPRLLRFALGPSLGQCCGGLVWVLAERIAPAALPDWQTRRDWLGDHFGLLRQIADGELQSRWQRVAAHNGNEGPDFTHFETHDAHWRLTQQMGAEPFPVRVFGAGHVGSAVVNALAPLGARIGWIDGREYLFPDELPDNVVPIAPDTPTAEVRDAPPGTYFLVMTHSHALDFELCEAIFARQDFAWFGLIGSTSKRNNFARQLTARGLPPGRLADLTCPIGIAGIQGKQPEVIAAAVAAQLLQVREARSAILHATHPGPDVPPLSSLPRPQ